MKVILGEFNEEASFFHSIIENRESDKKSLPCRGYRKTFQEFYGNYVNEVVIGVTHNDLPQNPDGYDLFNQTIETKLKRKSINNKINIINFFGDKSTNLDELLSFEDISLLTDFEQRYNDHFVSLPFTLKYHDKTYQSSQILEDIKGLYSDYVSTLKISNLLGYLPAYVSHRELEAFIKLYMDNNLTIDSPIGKLNFVPLLVDFKNSLPENYKRSISKLRQLKLSYLKEGYYLFYYAFSPGTPRVNMNNRTALAKEFLLAYLGFDVIGSSFAKLTGGGGNSQEINVSAGRFAANDYNYHLDVVLKKDFPRVKPNNLTIQTQYLSTISEQMKDNREIVHSELKRRPMAYEYLETYK